MPARTITTPVGNLTIMVESGTVRGLDWHHPGRSDLDPVLDRAEEQLNGYFAGEIRPFELSLAPQGSSHEQAVWRAILAIPPGRTDTYGAMARAIGSSPLAVGRACGRNPIPVIIPCHRVVGDGGGLGGYSGSGGVDTKRFLLVHVGAACVNPLLI